LSIWKRITKVRFRAITASVILLIFGSQIMVKTLEEWQRWDRLQRNQVQTEANIISSQVLIKQSGGVKNYEISYEFTAPGQGGLSTSRAELQRQLQDRFFNNPSGSVPDEPVNIPPRDDNKQYFSRTQTVEPSSSVSSTGSTISIVYDASDPQNSLIAGTGRYPTPEAVMISAMLALGGFLGYLGVAPCFKGDRLDSNEKES
jgi:hypothetical protein